MARCGDSGHRNKDIGGGRQGASTDYGSLGGDSRPVCQTLGAVQLEGGSQMLVPSWDRRGHIIKRPGTKALALLTKDK